MTLAVGSSRPAATSSASVSGAEFLFLTPHCLLRPTTNRIFDVRVCDSLAKHIEAVTIVSPYREMEENISESDIRNSYGIRNQVVARIVKIPCWSGRGPEWLEIMALVGFAIYVTISLLWQDRPNRRNFIIASRSPLLVLPSLVLRSLLRLKARTRVFLFLHEVKEGRPFRKVYGCVDGLITTNFRAGNTLKDRLGIDPDKLFVLGSPVPDALIAENLGREHARRQIGLHGVCDPIIVYTGKLVGRELTFILEAAELLPEYRFILTAGKKAVVEECRSYCKDRHIENVTFTGFFDDSTHVWLYQRSADVLVSYYTSDIHDVRYNFPQKIAEYMAAGAPIVTPDYPATAGVLNARNAVFVEPENTESLVDGIRRAVENKAESLQIARQAQRDAQQMTYSQRILEMWAFIKGALH